jgi:hypothetical protein
MCAYILHLKRVLDAVRGSILNGHLSCPIARHVKVQGWQSCMQIRLSENVSIRRGSDVEDDSTGEDRVQDRFRPSFLS